MSITSVEYSKLLTLLREESLGLAESCTGGLVSSIITRIPGASQVFSGAVVAYSNEVKVRALGVPRDLLNTHGAVSSHVALAMARGIGRLAGSSVCASVTGIAGPLGGSPEKPVGTVYIAVIVREKEFIGHFVFPGDRQAVQNSAAHTLLGALMDLLRNDIPKGFSQK
ncbi:CinA family protein [Myxococcota bacterium]|nr:CinA family protein [Myxococcota bacterium]MBU1534666.1 CinA family protein [Myxococcota bacterium]